MASPPFEGRWDGRSENRTWFRETEATIPNRIAKDFVPDPSNRSWPNAEPSMAVDLEYFAGLWNARSPGCISSAASERGMIDETIFTKDSSASAAP